MSVEEASSLVIRIFGSPQPLRTVYPSEEPDTRLSASACRSRHWWQETRSVLGAKHGARLS